MAVAFDDGIGSTSQRKYKFISFLAAALRKIPIGWTLFAFIPYNLLGLWSQKFFTDPRFFLFGDLKAVFALHQLGGQDGRVALVHAVAELQQVHR